MPNKNVEVKINKSGLDTLLGDLENSARRVVSAAAQKAADDMYAEAKSAISDFYHDYDPVKYLRSDAFYNNAFERYFLNSHRKLYHGGVRLTPEDMPVHTNISGQDVTSLVYKRVMYFGEHGGELFFQKSEIPVTNPTVIERLYIKQQEIINNAGRYLDAAMSLF